MHTTSTSSVKHGAGGVLSWTCVAASGKSAVELSNDVTS